VKGEALTVYEVGLRDGLQNEERAVSTAQKGAVLDALLAAGLREFEVTSFVNPTAVPQMADAEAVMALSRSREGCRPTALVVNDRGYDRAVATGCRDIAIVTVVTETLCARNNRMTVLEGKLACGRLVRRAVAEGVRCRVYVAPAWVCPFEGNVPAARAFEVAELALGEGAELVSIADTIGHAHPEQVERLLTDLAARFGAARLGAHFHDTQGLGLANAYAALRAGIRVLDSSIGGLGGCPFAPGAAGNLATEDLVLLAEKMGLVTGIDWSALWRAVAVAEGAVDRPLGGRSRGFYESAKRKAEADSCRSGP
jgi:hydroxymethylglutaryl-CoA lyase